MVEEGVNGTDGAREELRGRRRHVWGPIPSEATTAAAGADGAPPAKRKRKSRWAAPEERVLGITGKELVILPEKITLSTGQEIVLPPQLTGKPATTDPEALQLLTQLNELERKIQYNIIDIPPDGERSPSPPPIYDSMGIRQNTREVRYKEKMMRKRNELIEGLICKDPTYRPPADYKPEKKNRKIFIPYKDFPGYNFIGLIIGPRGNTQKRMQQETNCRIAIRGRGSVKEGAARNPNHDYGEDEDLHVLVTGDRQEDVDAAARMIERLMQPLDEEMNEHKKLQLRELAALNGTLKDEQYCFLCGDSGHRQTECPKRALDVYKLPDQIQSKVEEQYARDVARMTGEGGMSLDQVGRGRSP